MGNLCKSMSVCFANPSTSLSCSTASDRKKRRKVKCSHPVIHEGRCLMCERAVHDDDHCLAFGFLIPTLRLSREYADWLREVCTRAALGFKKLHLILDLDHTLLHTVRLSKLTPEEEERLMPEAERNPEVGREGSSDIFLVGSETGQRLTKLRPFVREFLREAEEMFELTVYTMGGRLYASWMTKLLEPDGQYFGSRVITRQDCPVRGRKSLDVVLAKESDVLILDDTAAAWPDHAENLIPVEPFYYFSHGSKKRGVQPSFGHDESEHDGTLAIALQVLKGIHGRYFDPQLGLEGQDVRKLMRLVQNGVHNGSDDQAPPGDAT